LSKPTNKIQEVEHKTFNFKKTNNIPDDK